MRLAAQAKMGYYPTPQSLIPIIAGYLKRKEPGLMRIFDPCAGEGTALQALGRHLQAETYGVELDRERGQAAKQKLTQCLVTDYQSVQITHQFAGLLFLNPPYDWSVKEDTLENSIRYERAFLRDTVKYLMPGGVLVYLIPLKRLDGIISRMLAYRFERIKLYKFPESFYQQFRQVVLFGKIKKTPALDENVCRFLTAAGQGQAIVPFLPEEPEFFYEAPGCPKNQKFIFRTYSIEPEELEKEIKQYGLFEELQEMLTPRSLSEKITAIMPLRHGHLAQLIACGFINGLALDKNHQNPLIVKGLTRKIAENRVEIEGDLEKHIETERLVITIKAFTQTGDLITIE